MIVQSKPNIIFHDYGKNIDKQDVLCKNKIIHYNGV